MNSQIRNALTLGAVVIASGVVLAGCNTTAGIGKDVSSAGQAVTSEANEVQQKL